MKILFSGCLKRLKNLKSSITIKIGTLQTGFTKVSGCLFFYITHSYDIQIIDSLNMLFFYS
ncbi:MAG: hypothetical protein J6V99_04350 [Neisseriaceae bacterium]|nr:hypothetical protein [Neisseriaceae bacterium]